VDNDQIRAAGRVAGRMARNAGKEWMPAVRNSGTFVKHVVPAAVKPLHSLWHEMLGFIFLLIAGAAAFKMWKNASTTSPIMMILAGFLVLVTAGYGISSILKARRISRS
jgi:heme A synthase